MLTKLSVVAAIGLVAFIAAPRVSRCPKKQRVPSVENWWMPGRNTKSGPG
jgi:hypothetical protein